MSEKITQIAVSIATRKRLKAFSKKRGKTMRKMAITAINAYIKAELAK